MNNILLSIIIPTKNRQNYCFEAIKSILFDLDERCEIIVQDNSNDKTLEELLRNLNDNRIVYNYLSKPLSFVDNFEEALMQSSGKYFIVLGDDDSTTKDILKIVDWMEKNDIESVSSSIVVDYIWPNADIEKFKKGILKYPDYKGNIKKINVEENLNALIKNGFLAYQTFNLPRTYHGIVKRSCMDEVKKIAGRYFSGLTPDIYSTIALACIIKNHCIIDFPFSIAGACPASATVHSTVGGHSGKLSDAPHFKFRGNYTWEPTIPRYYSVETIWAETAIKALKDMGYNQWENKFNKYKLYVYGIFINRKYILKLSISETMALAKNLGKNKLAHSINLLTELVNIIRKKAFKSKNVSQSPALKTIEGVSDLNQCKNIVYQDIMSVPNNF